MEFENNAYFWQKLDTLLLSSDLLMDKPKGSVHPTYHNLVYPVDYGHLKSNNEDITEHIGIYKGSLNSSIIESIVVCVDILKKDIEVKLLMACTKEEETSILEFLNQTDFQKTVIIKRGNSIPGWATSINA